jgi:hypothetical protein
MEIFRGLGNDSFCSEEESDNSYSGRVYVTGFCIGRVSRNDFEEILSRHIARYYILIRGMQPPEGLECII